MLLELEEELCDLTAALLLELDELCDLTAAPLLLEEDWLLLLTLALLLRVCAGAEFTLEREEL